MQEHRREVLREASVALQGRPVTLWEVSSRAEVVPVLTSAGSAHGADTRLDLDSTLHRWGAPIIQGRDRKSTRLNSSHGYISYAVFCLKKKNKMQVKV